MSPEELRDELMTLLVAGHETTASQLAWTFERLVRTPAALKGLSEELRDGEGAEAYLTATIQESLRRRPVLGNAAPRLVKQPVEIGGWRYPVDVCVVANAYLIHHDPAIYPEPYAFRPERFLDEGPGTYTWIPFGGGRRRCLGASFALLEMKIVLRRARAARCARGRRRHRGNPAAQHHLQPGRRRTCGAERARARARRRIGRSHPGPHRERLGRGHCPGRRDPAVGPAGGGFVRHSAALLRQPPLLAGHEPHGHE
jgi:Cytochrome P450